MNTFAAMKPAPRPPEALGVRSGAEAVAASPEGVAEAFGAVLGALKEGRPAKETGHRADEAGDEAAPGASPSLAEAANPLFGLVDAGSVPQGTTALMDPAALQALLTRAVPGASAPGGMPSATALSGQVSGAPSMPGQAASGQVASGQVVLGPEASEPVASGEAVSVPVGVADVAAGIAMAIDANGPARNGLVQRGQTQPGSIQANAVLAGSAPQSPAKAPGETRSPVTILQQETHFAPVRPRLVAGQAVAMPAMAAQAGAPAPVAPTPIPATATPAATEAVLAAHLSAPTALGVDASAPGSAPAAPSQGPAAAIQAGAPTPEALPTPSPESDGRPRRAETASVEATIVPSPAARRLAGQALPVEGTRTVSAEMPAAEAGPREGVVPVATAPGGALPSAATLGEPARQVAEAVASELSRPAATATTDAASPGGEGPLRLLTIQLRPMDLGTVLVRMRLRDGQLEVSLHASREETAALLRQDGALLTDLLRSSGYQPDTITIASNGAGAPSQGEGGRPGAGTPFQPGGQGGQAQGGANPDQTPRRQGDANTDERTDLTHERIHETTSSGPDRSGLYL